MIFILALVLLFAFVLGMLIIVYINHQNIDKLNKLALGDNSDIDNRFSSVVNGINYNDAVLGNVQEKLLQDINDLEMNLDLMKNEINQNEKMITELKQRLPDVITTTEQN